MQVCVEVATTQKYVLDRNPYPRSAKKTAANISPRNGAPAPPNIILEYKSWQRSVQEKTAVFFFRRPKNTQAQTILSLGGYGGSGCECFLQAAAVFFADPGTNISRSISKGVAFCLYREWATACGSWRRWCWRVDGEGSTEGMSGCGCVGVGGGRAYLLELSWQRVATRGNTDR